MIKGIYLPADEDIPLEVREYGDYTDYQAYLVGDAVIVGIPDDEGETTSIPDQLLRALTHAGLFRVEVQLQRDPKWYTNLQRYPDFWEAAEWAGLLRERWGEVELIRVVPDEPSHDDEPDDDESFNGNGNPQIGDPT